MTWAGRRCIIMWPRSCCPTAIFSMTSTKREVSSWNSWPTPSATANNKWNRCDLHEISIHFAWFCNWKAKNRIKCQIFNIFYNHEQRVNFHAILLATLIKFILLLWKTSGFRITLCLKLIHFLLHIWFLLLHSSTFSRHISMLIYYQ